MEYILRFLIGGLIVSAFSVIGDVLKPKSFAGLFGAAPSVALATLSLTIFKSGKEFAAMEARSMIAGAFAFLIYASLCIRLMAKDHLHAVSATIPGLVVWLVFALAAWLVVLR